MDVPVPMVVVKEKVVWQYRVVERSLGSEGPPTEAELNALGGKGWELAGVYTEGKKLGLFFKRLARDEGGGGGGGFGSS